MAVTNADSYERLLALPAWSAYTRGPGQTTFAQLVNDAKAFDLREQLPRALAHLFLGCPHWKVAQHLANELIEIEDVTLARYYAGKAVSLSQGHILAKLSLARCFWLQHFVEALMVILNEMISELNTVESEAQRGLVHYEIVELYVRIYCYGNRPDLARPWVEKLAQFPRFRVELIVQWAMSSHELGYNSLAFSAATLLAQCLHGLTEREKMLVNRIAQVRFLELLGEHQHGE